MKQKPSNNQEHAAESQRSAALAEANRVRARRGKLKKHLKTGGVSLAYIFDANKQFVSTMRILDLLLATPGMGHAKSERVLRTLQISPKCPLECLSFRRREELLRQLEADCPSVKVR